MDKFQLAAMASAGKAAFKSREEYKKAKELEEARKAGTAAPEVDEHGNDINPHIPQYISEVPWYIPSTGPTLKHQRNILAAERKFDKLGTWYARGRPSGPVSTKYRKGACENCGALTHSRKDCLERPRARGAKWTGEDIAADGEICQVNLDWEGKRDRWNGYDPQRFKDVQERYAKIESERMQLRAENLDKRLRNRSSRGLKENASIAKEDNTRDSDASSEDDDAEPFRQSDAGEVVIQQTEQGAPTTVRNLRIREDTAKYLRNLDVNSAYYDPKTRSMRADPTPNMPGEDKDFAGDNFIRCSGDVKDLARMELHALKAAEEGRDLPHLLAEPTMAEEVFQDFASRKTAVEERRRAQIAERYGGEKYVNHEADATRMQESEVYVEYNREGQLLKESQTSRPASKYAEDIYENKHTSVWGSFYRDGKWGYDCCHQMSRNAYCTGEAGKKAAKAVEDEIRQKTVVAQRHRMELYSESERRSIPDGRNASGKRPTSFHTEDFDSKRRRHEEQSRAATTGNGRSDLVEKRRDIVSRDVLQDVTEEDMEEYNRMKRRADDPLAHLLT